MMENEAIAIELTKLVVGQSRPPVGADYFHLATDYLSVYRYVLNDLQQHSSANGQSAPSRRLG